MDVLYPIIYDYVVKILDRTKKYEFRKAIYQKEIERIFIYASRKCHKIVGYFYPGMIFKAHPQDIWTLCKEFAGIEKEPFFKYFDGKEIGYAIEITHLHVYPKALDPFQYISGFKAPQNYMYLSNGLNKVIIND